jgi:hypothetical protein
MLVSQCSVRRLGPIHVTLDEVKRAMLIAIAETQVVFVPKTDVRQCEPCVACDTLALGGSSACSALVLVSSGDHSSALQRLPPAIEAIIIATGSLKCHSSSRVIQHCGACGHMPMGPWAHWTRGTRPVGSHLVQHLLGTCQTLQSCAQMLP